MERKKQPARFRVPLPMIGTWLLAGVTASAQTTMSYYFAHIAAADVWRATFTYVNASTQTVTCNTSFYSDS